MWFLPTIQQCMAGSWCDVSMDYQPHSVLEVQPGLAMSTGLFIYFPSHVATLWCHLFLLRQSPWLVRDMTFEVSVLACFSNLVGPQSWGERPWLPRSDNPSGSRSIIMTTVKFPAPECLLATQITSHSAMSQCYPFLLSTPTAPIAGSCYNFPNHCAGIAFSLCSLSSNALQNIGQSMAISRYSLLLEYEQGDFSESSMASTLVVPVGLSNSVRHGVVFSRSSAPKVSS